MTQSSDGQISVDYIDHMGSDLTTVNAARVSFGKKSTLVCKEGDDCCNMPNCYGKLSDRDTNLINYLAKHKHMSPFGHAFASFHVKAPIFVARQLVKHKFLRWNEISRRYVDDEPEFYLPAVWRGRSEDKKQGSDGVTYTDALFVQTGYDQWEGAEYTNYNEISIGVYKEMLQDGVAPEQARMVLPQSTMTEWWWSGSLDAFADMCKLRLKDDTQYETRLVAQMIDKEMATMFPVSWAALVTGYTDE